jgi:hypothetical protein
MKWGFYTGDLTGIFDVDLETSVKKWQGHRGLTVTGVIDADDRAAILGSRHDGAKDVHTGESKANYRPGSTIKWHLDKGVPAYMKKDGRKPHDCVIEEITAAFGQWNKELAPFKIKFVYTDNKGEEDMFLSFTENPNGSIAENLAAFQNHDETPGSADAHAMANNNLLAFDGAGGELAKSTKDYIIFDRSERWRLQSQEGTGDGFQPKLLEVLFHEIGHVVGMTHSEDPEAVMSPYYVEGRLDLTEDDRQRLKKMIETTVFPPQATYSAPAAAGICSCFGS